MLTSKGFAGFARYAQTPTLSTLSCKKEMPERTAMFCARALPLTITEIINDKASDALQWELPKKFPLRCPIRFVTMSS